jgi:hypothetical protein
MGGISTIFLWLLCADLGPNCRRGGWDHHLDACLPEKCNVRFPPISDVRQLRDGRAHLRSQGRDQESVLELIGGISARFLHASDGCPPMLRRVKRSLRQWRSFPQRRKDREHPRTDARKADRLLLDGMQVIMMPRQRRCPSQPGVLVRICTPESDDPVRTAVSQASDPHVAAVPSAVWRARPPSPANVSYVARALKAGYRALSRASYGRTALVSNNQLKGRTPRRCARLRDYA